MTVLNKPQKTATRQGSFIHSEYLYSAPSRNQLRALSVQLRPKWNVLRSLQKEDTLFRGNKRVQGSCVIKTFIHSRQNNTTISQASFFSYYWQTQITLKIIIISWVFVLPGTVKKLKFVSHLKHHPSPLPHPPPLSSPHLLLLFHHFHTSSWNETISLWMS